MSLGGELVGLTFTAWTLNYFILYKDGIFVKNGLSPEFFSAFITSGRPHCASNAFIPVIFNVWISTVLKEVFLISTSPLPQQHSMPWFLATILAIEKLETVYTKHADFDPQGTVSKVRDPSDALVNTFFCREQNRYKKNIHYFNFYFWFFSV